MANQTKCIKCSMLNFKMFVQIKHYSMDASLYNQKYLHKTARQALDPTTLKPIPLSVFSTSIGHLNHNNNAFIRALHKH